MKFTFPLSQNALITGILILFIVLGSCGYGLKRDQIFWKKNRQDIIALSEKVIILSKKTGIIAFTRYSIGTNFKTQIAMEDVSKIYPEYADDFKQIVKKIKLIRFDWIIRKPGYIAFFKSGGFGTDTVLLHVITDNGFNEFLVDFKKDGLAIQKTMELEKSWLYVYTD